jgi:protein-histidine pros-kinase
MTPARLEASFESRFRKLLEAAPDAILEVNPDGQIILLNEVDERIFGHSRGELLGENVEMPLPARHVRRSFSEPLGAGK